MKNLSTILSQLMTDKNLNSAELARATGIGQPVIYRLMTGATENPQILTLKPIADFFGVTIDQLLGYTTIIREKSHSSSAISLDSKIRTAITIVSALQEMLPTLIESYSRATASLLMQKTISETILLLFPINISNLLSILNELQENLDINY